MKLVPPLAVTLVLGVGLVALAVPASAAVVLCSEAANKVVNPDCQHLVCLYPSYYGGSEYCRFSEDAIPDCGPGCLYLP